MQARRRRSRQPSARFGILAFVVLVVASLSVALAEETPAPPTLRVGTSGDYRPFSVRQASGELAGFDIDVARRLGSDLGRQIEFVPFRWSDLVAQLRAGAFDIAMSGVTVRADRAITCAFSRPYAVTGAVAVIRAHDRTTFRRVTDLDRKDRRIVVNAGGHLEQIARQRFVHADVIPVTDNAALPDLLRRGDADAAVSETLEAQTWPAAEFSTIGPFTHDRKAYAVRREATDLRRQVNDWLAAREADGWLNAQRRRWLGQRAVLTPERACFEALVGALDLRLQLMPLVAAVKRREQLPIEDPVQEARVLERVRGAAAAAGVNQDDVAALFRVQMEAAKAVERHAAAAAAPPDRSLDDVRAAVGGASDQIIAELARCQSWLHGRAATVQLDSAVRSTLVAAGLPASLAARLVAALQRVRPS